jgi:hypothetical protein
MRPWSMVTLMALACSSGSDETATDGSVDSGAAADTGSSEDSASGQDTGSGPDSGGSSDTGGGEDTGTEPELVTPSTDPDASCIAPDPYPALDTAALGVASTGLVGWFRGDVVHQLESGEVCRWEDLSGSEQHLDDTAGRRPTLGTLGGEPAVSFEGGGYSGGDQLSRSDAFGIPGDSARTFVVVTAHSASDLSRRTQPFAMIGSSSLGSDWIMIESNTWQTRGRFGVYMTNNAYDGEVAMDANPHILAMRLADGTVGADIVAETTFRVDGVVQTLTETGSSAGNGLVESMETIQRSLVAPLGTLAEVLVYDRALTDQELTDLESYLDGRYGILPQPE